MVTATATMRAGQPSHSGRVASGRQRSLPARALSHRRAPTRCHPGVATRRPRQPASLAVNARREYSDNEYNFDEEEDWESNGTRIGATSGQVISQALRAVGIVSDKLTDVAIQLAPEDAPPGVVRTAVNAGVVLLILAFAKSILGFFLTIGTVIFGAYLAVRVFGLDVATGPISGSSSSSKAHSKQKSGPTRKTDARARQSEWRGLLGAPDKKRDDGLLDVWFGSRKGEASKKRR